MTTAPVMSLPPELVQFKRALRRFVDEELIPHERAGTLPDEARARVRNKARELGIWAAGAPTELGGAGFGALEYAVMVEELSRSVYGVPEVEALGQTMPALIAGSPEQIETYTLPTIRGERIGAFALTEPTGGSDPGSAMRTTAVRDGDRWVINGRKCFISNSDRADYWLVIAITDHEKRQRGGMTAFLVDRGTPGFEIVRNIPTMGRNWPGELDLHDVVVGDEQRLGEVGQAFTMAQELLGPQRAAIGARAVGVATRLLELAIEYARHREVFGKALGAHGQAQAMIADCAIETEACRWLVYRTAAEADRGVDVRVLASASKVYGSELMTRVADKVLQLHGGWGLTTDFPIERFYRDNRMYRIVEGPNEVHRMVIARQLVKNGLEDICRWDGADAG